MKKRRWGALLVCGIAAFLPFIFSACVFTKETPQVMHTHIWMLEDTVEPTCTEQGYDIMVCAEDPTHILHTNFTPINHDAHKYDGGVVFKPTVLGDGYTKYTCERNTAHFYTDTVVTLEEYQAANPEEEYDGHQWEVKEVVAPTCSAEGYTVYECALDHSIRHGDITPINQEAHDWTSEAALALIEVVPPTCISDGYTLHVCAHNHTHTQKTDIIPANPDDLTLHDWQEVEVVAPTCSTLGYTIYECAHEPTHIKHDNFVDADPNAHAWEGFVVHEQATADKPAVLRNTCANGAAGDTADAPTYLVMPAELQGKYPADALLAPPYYVGAPHYRQKYETANIAFGTDGLVDITGAGAVQWFNLPKVDADTFTELSLTLTGGNGSIALYEFNADAADTEFTEGQEAEFTDAVKPVIDNAKRVTLYAGRVYFIKVIADAAAAGTVLAVNIVEVDEAGRIMLDKLSADARVAGITNVTPNVEGGYKFGKIIRVRLDNGDEAVVSHSTGLWADSIACTKDSLWANNYYYTKMYRFGSDIFTFAIVTADIGNINQAKYDSLLYVINTVAGDVSAADDTYVWAFTTFSSDPKVIDGYYGLDEVVVIPYGYTSIMWNNNRPQSLRFGGKQFIREVVFEPSRTDGTYSIISIGMQVFQNCRGLEVFALPTSVKTVGQDAFAGCGSLKFVYYDGAYPRTGIDIRQGNNNLANNLIYYSEKTAPTPVGTERYWRWVSNAREIWNNNTPYTVTFGALNNPALGSTSAVFGAIIPAEVLAQYESAAAEAAAAAELSGLVFKYWYYVLDGNEIQYTNQRISGAMTLYAKYSSSYDFGDFDAVTGTEVDYFKHTGTVTGGTFEYYLYFDGDKCRTEYFKMLQSRYFNYRYIVAYLFGKEMFIAYGSSAVDISLEDYDKNPQDADEQYDRATGRYPLSTADWGNDAPVHSYMTNLFNDEGWNSVETTARAGSLPSDIESLPFVLMSLINDGPPSDLLIVNVSTVTDEGDRVQLMKSLLRYKVDLKLTNATEVMREGEYLFMIISSVYDIDDMKDILEISGDWDKVIRKFDLLSEEVQGYYNKITADSTGTYTGLVIAFDAKSISFRGTTMSVKIEMLSAAAFDALTPTNNQYITLLGDLVFTFTPTGSTLSQAEIDNLKTLLEITSWDNEKGNTPVS